MKETNNVITVTYPSLYLPTANSMVLSFIGLAQSDIDKIQTFFETNFYENELVFYVFENPTNEETVAWANAATANSNFIFVNAEKANSTEIALSFITEEIDDSIVVTYLALSDQECALTRVLKFTGKHVMDSIDDLEDMLKDIIQHEFIQNNRVQNDDNGDDFGFR